MERVGSRESGFYPSLIDEDGTRRPTFRARRRWTRTLRVPLAADDVLVDGHVLESLAVGLWGEWQMWKLLADASATVRHPAEWGVGTIVTIPDLQSEDTRV